MFVSQPLSGLLPLFLFVGSLERQLLSHFIMRVGISFSVVNAELQQLAALVRQRAGLATQPDMAEKIAHMRSQHEGATGLLLLVTECYEVQMSAIMLYDFISSTMAAYLFMVGVTQRVLTVLMIISVLNCCYSTICTLVLSHSGRWTHLQVWNLT